MKSNTIIHVSSPANIAFIKYWGQKHTDQVLPYNDSFSMNLSNCHTNIELEVHDDPKIQTLFIKDYKSPRYVPNSGAAQEKVIRMYNTAKKYLKSSHEFGFTVRSTNSFPKKAGIASSASFFSGLALAFTKAFGVELSEKDLSILSRLSGSGSACRSIPDGFVMWNKGYNSDSSYAFSIAAPDYWDLADIVLIITAEEKKTGSEDGHKKATTSGLYKYRQMELKERIPQILKAFNNKDITTFGRLVEEETLSMHSVMMSQQLPLHYWSGKTVEILKAIVDLRAKGTEAYYTIDAGENVHVICVSKDVDSVRNHFTKHELIQDMITNYPTIGAGFI